MKQFAEGPDALRALLLRGYERPDPSMVFIDFDKSLWENPPQ